MSAEQPRVRVGVEGYTLSIRRTGVGRYVANLLIAAARVDPGLGLTAVLYPDEPAGPARTDDLEAAGIAVRVPSRLAIRGYLKLVKLGAPASFAALAGRHDVLVYTNYRWFPTGGRPCLSFVYDLGFRVHPECIDPGIIEHLERDVPRLVERSDRIGVISHEMARQLAETYPGCADRLVVLHPGVPEQATRPAPADWVERLARLGLAPGFVLHVGTIEPRKNLECLVEAFEQLPAETATAHPLVLVGGRGWQDHGIRAAILRAGARVHHAPYVDSDDLRALYAGARLLAFPSRYEGFGLPVLEAMRMGAPVACSDIAVLREVAGDAAVYFDHTDPAAIATSLAGLLGDDARLAVLRERGHARARRFDWDETGRRFAAVLRELAR